jgi:hypothetical protein
MSIFGENLHSPKWSFLEIFDTRQSRRHSPTIFARTRQTHGHSPKAICEKNVTRLAKFARVLSESRKFGASGHYLNVTQLATYHNYLTYIAYLDFQA